MDNTYIPVSSNDTLLHLALPSSPETLCGRIVVNHKVNFSASDISLKCDFCDTLSGGHAFLKYNEAPETRHLASDHGVNLDVLPDYIKQDDEAMDLLHKQAHIMESAQVDDKGKTIDSGASLTVTCTNPACRKSFSSQKTSCPFCDTEVVPFATLSPADRVNRQTGRGQGFRQVSHAPGRNITEEEYANATPIEHRRGQTTFVFDDNYKSYKYHDKHAFSVCNGCGAVSHPPHRPEDDKQNVEWISRNMMHSQMSHFSTCPDAQREVINNESKYPEDYRSLQVSHMYDKLDGGHRLHADLTDDDRAAIRPITRSEFLKPTGPGPQNSIATEGQIKRADELEAKGAFAPEPEEIPESKAVPAGPVQMGSGPLAAPVPSTSSMDRQGSLIEAKFQNWTRDGVPIEDGFNLILTTKEAAEIPYLDTDRVAISDKIHCPDCNTDEWLARIASCVDCGELKCDGCMDSSSYDLFIGTCKKCANISIEDESYYLNSHDDTDYTTSRVASIFFDDTEDEDVLTFLPFEE